MDFARFSATAAGQVHPTAPALRLPPDLQTALSDLALAEHLTPSALIVRLIDEALTHRLEH